MKKKFIFKMAGCALMVSAVFTACNDAVETKASEVQHVVVSETEVIKKGEHLVTIMGCNDCHSPKRMGANGPEIIPELMLSGFPADRPLVKFDSKLLTEGFAMFYPDLTAAAGPWGVSFASNLTPDDTGLGNWTEAQFKKALTEGKSKGLDGSRMLLPPMPWTNFTKLSNDEVHAVYTYLRSIQPVKNLVPNPITPDKM
ncbi:MAG: c-type cytochrome [Ferruginibacter sp.]|nr:c-type cytochrome [Ferruginibacter sp.]